MDIRYRNAIQNLLHAFDKPLIDSLLRIINQMKITFAYTVPKEERHFTEFVGLELPIFSDLTNRFAKLRNGKRRVKGVKPPRVSVPSTASTSGALCGVNSPGFAARKKIPSELTIWGAAINQPERRARRWKLTKVYRLFGTIH